MAMLLTEARAALKSAVLFCGGSFQDEKLDYAIIESGERFIHEAFLNRTVATATTTSSNKAVDVSATTADFVHYDTVDVAFISPGSSSPSWRRLNVVALEVLRGLHEQYRSATGEPEFLAWVSPTTCWLFPTPDATYTLNLPYSQPLTTSTWTAGTQGTYSASKTYALGDVVTHTPGATAYTYRSLTDGANLNNTPADNASTDYWQLIGATATYPAPNPQGISLNIHKKWAIAWLRSGARGSLLLGAQGHQPQAESSLAEFDRLISRARDAAIPDGVWYADGGEDNERQYGPHYLSM